MSTYKIALIGDSSTVLGFAAGGVTGYAAQQSQEALEKLREFVSSKEYAIILITETLAEPIVKDIAGIETGSIPSIIIVPDQGGAKGIGFEKIRLSVERALGIDLLGKTD